MKFTVTVTPIKPRFAPIVFTNGISEYLSFIAEQGFDAIELHIADPTKIDHTALRNELDGHGLTLSMIGSGLAYGQEGLTWTDPDPDIRRRAIDRMKAHIDMAGEYGAAVAVGLLRGPWIKKDPAQTDAMKQRMRDAMGECMKYAETAGATLAVEPINRYEVDYMNSVPETLDFVKDFDSPNVGVLCDTFHMNIEEKSIIESLKAAGKRIVCVHLSDSNRWAPGYGHLDIAAVLKTLKEIGYERWISLEVLPLPTPKEAAVQGITHIKKTLASI